MPASNFATNGSATHSTSGANLTVNQTTPKAILNWKSFNISADAAVRFVQPSASAAALNRIQDANPSVILGRLIANGQIYLVNQNGIIFGKGAQVDANTIVASALNISDQRFLNGLLSDAAALEAAVPTGFVRVDEGATLVSAREGRIMLLAPEVSNRGVIESRDGQIILAAGQKVFLSASQSPALRGLLVEVDGAGTAANLDLGQLVVERGNATLAALAVNQSGRISATTSVVSNGSVRLVARGSSGGGQVVLGEGSRIEILPDTDRNATIQDAQRFTPSTVEIAGKTVELRENASIRAPGGKVSITAQKSSAPGEAPQDDVRIYMAPGSSIDVSGVQDVAVPIERNVLKVELRGDELKDSPLQRTSTLRGKTVYVDARVGTPLADVSAYQTQIGRTAQEKLAVGGTVELRSEGDVVLRDGSRVDVSGGSIRYLDGQVRTTKLLSQGRVYDIGQASPDLVYEGLADTFTRTSSKWGVSQTWQAPADFVAGYSEGKDAGTFAVVAHAVVLDGQLTGSTLPGPLQRALATRPRGGELVLGNVDGGQTNPANYWLGDVRFEAGPSLLDMLFGAGGPSGPLPLPADRRDTAYVPTGIFRNGGFTRARIVANGAALIPESEVIVIGAGGDLSITAREIDVRGTVVAPGGTISLTTRDTIEGTSSEPNDYDIVLAGGARLSTAGSWVNDQPKAAGSPIGAVVLDGGAISLSSFTDVTLARGSVIDVTGGGWIDTHGKLSAGDGGGISLMTGRFRSGAADQQTTILTLDGTLLGHALGTGGTVSLSTSSVAFGAAPGAPGRLDLTPDFLRRGGFQRYSISGSDGVVVGTNVALAPLTESLILGPGFRVAPTGSNLRSFTQVRALPAELLAATSLELSAGSPFRGSVTIGDGASITVGPAGSIKLTAARQLTVLGRLEARGGDITLSTPAPTQFNDPFFADQSIWLGEASRLVASGVSQVFAQPNGRLFGDILPGGRISIEAGKGYLVMRESAVIDVSGVTGVVDIAVPAGIGRSYDRRAVGSSGGSVSLRAREGMLLEGSILGAGAGGARGGDLSLSFVGYSSTLLIPEGGAFPAATRRFVLAPSTAALSDDVRAVLAGLQPGDVIDSEYADPGQTTLNGGTLVLADRIGTSASGMDSLVLRGPDSGDELGRVEVIGKTALQLNRSIELDMPAVEAAAGSSLTLRAARVTLANRDSRLQAPQTVLEGDALLRVEARNIDLVGELALSGFDSVELDSAGDIRAVGVLQGAVERSLEGTLRTAGDVTLRAAQIYPTTLSDFSIDVTAGSKRGIVIQQDGVATPVLSAAGAITLRAYSIEQGGTLKAPFGRIQLEADHSVTLLAGSVTSTSGVIEGPGGSIPIPFGTTEQNQRDFVYSLDDERKLLFTVPPEKQVILAAPEVTIESTAKSGVKKPAARIDLSGGGDLYAYEFVPGPGGSRDVLDPANSPGLFAIVPWLSSDNPAYDHLYYQGVAGLTAGEAVQLTGVDGLTERAYVLMPARYALVRGAYLVRQVAGTTDFLPFQAYRLSDGTQVVAGRVATPNRDGSYTTDTRSSGFEVVTGAIARTRSEYLDTRAGSFFAGADGAQLPGDAGRLSIAKAQALVLGGNVVAAHAGGFRGAGLDISTEKLAIVSGTAKGGDGFVDIDVGTLRSLDVSSVLLGGTRKRVDGTLEIEVGSREVKIITAADQPLSAEEVLLAATDSIAIEGKSVIEAKGGVGGGRAAHYRLVNTLDADDDGAFVRVANSGFPALERGASDRSSGSIAAAAGTILRGTSIVLDATLSNAVKGTLELGQGGALSLGAGLISLGEVATVTEGLALGQDELAQLSKLDRVQLRSYSSIDLYGAAAFGRDKLAVTLEAGALRGFDNAGVTSRIGAASIVLGNSAGAAPGALPVLQNGGTPPLGTGKLELNAGSVVLAAGSGERGVAVTGFSSVGVTATQVVVAGKGSLNLDGALSIGSAGMSAETAADYSIAASGALNITGTGSASHLSAPGLGAVLRLSGATVAHGGVIDLPSGQIVIDSAGDIALLAGSVLRTAGMAKPFEDVVAAMPGGTIDLRSASGSILVNGIVDASAADDGEPGMVRVATPGGTFAVASQGHLSAGAFELDASAVEDFSALNQALNAGGFGVARAITARSGNIQVGAADVVTARSILLSADDGNITVAGVLDASGPKGGKIEVFARRGDSGPTGNIVVASGAHLDASASEAASQSAGSHGDGGAILLAISDAQTADTPARIDVHSGATIDVSGKGAGSGGTLALRAPRLAASTDRIAIAHLGTDVQGAREIVVEPFKVYSATTIGTGNAPGNFNFTTTGAPFTETLAFVDTYKTAILTRLGGDPRLHLRPGIEIRSSSDLQLSADWNLCGTAATCATGSWRFQGEPGVLTLRAVGDVVFAGSLSDGFSGATVATGVLRNVTSWSYRVAAGADLGRADILALRPPGDSTAGNFKLAAGKLMRTGTGGIEIAAARDMVLTGGASVIYTAGVPTDPPAGFTRIPTNVDGSGIGVNNRTALFPDGGGDIALSAGRDITTVASGQFISDWLYRYAQRDSTTGSLRVNPQTSWWPRYADFQQGVATLGGGDVSIQAGRDIQHLGVMAPTNGRLGGDPDTSIDPADPQALALLQLQGGGDIRVASGRDILGGYFLVDQGEAAISAGRNVTAAATGAGAAPPMRPVLALGAASAHVFAAGNLEIQTVVDATALPQLERFESSGTGRLATFFHRYAADSAVTLRSGTGDIRLFNNAQGVLSRNMPQLGDETDALTTYPGSLRAVAFSGDIDIDGALSVYPVEHGTLELLADGSVALGSDLQMLQSRARDFPSVLAPRTAYFIEGILPPEPIYQNDPQPVRVYALNGSISGTNARLVLAKQGWFSAGADILNLAVEGQNLRPTDITRYQAGGDIRFETKRDPSSGRLLLNSDTLQVNGPGRVELIAGGTVDLGNSIGVVTSGNIGNSTLPEGGASILVLAGFPADPRYAPFISTYIAPGAPTATEYAAALAGYVERLTGQSYPTADAAWAAFHALAQDQQAPFVRDVFFSELKASGRAFAAGGGAQAYDRGYKAIEVLFPAESLAATRHDINLFFSQIKTEQGGGIDLINPSGVVNAGLATAGEGAKSPAEQGIVTVRGGSIRGFVKDDFLVNQSRVFTLGGGDILLWSSDGDIDAGRGKKTASATPPPVLIVDPNGQVKLDVSNSISGSGIGVLLGREGIQAGDVDLIAPNGEVNAGDAGIRAAGNLTIAAVRVRGADNIQVGGVSTGVPASSGGLGANLAGVGNVAAEAAKSAERVTQELAADSAAQQQAGSLVPSFISVEVIGLGEEENKQRAK